MSRRPRLVEEGKPIDLEDIEMDLAEAEPAVSFISSNYSLDQKVKSSVYTIPANDGIQFREEASSSLARAASHSHHHHRSTNLAHYTRRSSAPSSDVYPRVNHGTSSMMAVEDDMIPFHEDYNHSTLRNPAHRHSTVMHSHSFVIGQGSTTAAVPTGDSHRMEIEDILDKPPLLVLDGANIAYAYALVAFPSKASSTQVQQQGPHVRGIQIAVDYFLKVQYRVQVVIPTSWIRSKRFAVLDPSQLDILHHLQTLNVLCCTPPTDDDDAYALAMARREDARARLRKFHSSRGGPKGGAYLDGGAFIVSNDLYRDAMERDGNSNASGELREWLEGTSSSTSCTDKDCGPPGRISYSFCDLGAIDRYGSAQLDFVPNPRHPLIQRIEELYRKLPGAF